MRIEITSTTKLVEAGTAEVTETLHAPKPVRTESEERPHTYDQVLSLGSSVLAPGLSTPLRS